MKNQPEPHHLARSLAPAFIAAGAALLLWSGTPIANKIAVGHIDGLTAGVLRSMAAGAIALLLAKFGRLPFPATAHDRITLLISGVSSFAVWPALMSLGLARTTAGHGALIMATIPIFTVLFALTLERRRPNLGWWLGASVAVAATAAVISGRASRSAVADDGASQIVGDLIILAGCVICAVGYVSGARLASKIGTVATTFWGLASALIVLVPTFALVVQRTDWAAVPMQAWLSIAWMTLCSSLAGYALWFYALGRGGAARIGSMELVSPVLTLTWATIILGEAATWRLGFLCAAIILGTYTAQRFSR